MDEPLFYGAPYFKYTQVNGFKPNCLWDFILYGKRNNVQLSSFADESVKLV